MLSRVVIVRIELVVRLSVYSFKSVRLQRQRPYYINVITRTLCYTNSDLKIAVAQSLSRRLRLSTYDPVVNCQRA